MAYRWLLIVCLLLPGAAGAADAISLAGGGGATNLGPGNGGGFWWVGAVWHWKWRQDHAPVMTAQWELTAGSLTEKQGTSDVRMGDVAFTPVFRLGPGVDGTGIYGEFGTGVHLLSDTRLEAVSTNLQFGSLLGIGMRFGGESRYELGYRVLHLSNGGIAEPNPGLNYHLLRVGYRF